MKRTQSTSRSVLRATLACAAIAAASWGLSGCRGERSDDPPHQFLPDMDDSPKFKPQTQTQFFADGRAMRPKVADTIAFGPSMDPDDPEREWCMNDNEAMFEGIDTVKTQGGPDGGPAYVPYIPTQVLDRIISHEGSRGHPMSKEEAMRHLIARGQQRFNIYCSACHGYQGEGAQPGGDTGGLVGRRWKSAVPTFHDPKYLNREQKEGQDGYVFHVIRNGVPETDAAKPPKMPSYADKVNRADAWAIVAYIRVLQASWSEGMQDVPENMRQELERSRPPMPPAATPSPAPAPAATPKSSSANQPTPGLAANSGGEVNP